MVNGGGATLGKGWGRVDLWTILVRVGVVVGFVLWLLVLLLLPALFPNHILICPDPKSFKIFLLLGFKELEGKFNNLKIRFF